LCSQHFRIKSQNTYFTQGAFQCPIEVPASDPSNYYQNHSPCYDYFKIVDKFQHPSDWLMLNYGSKLAIAVSNGLICLVSIVFAKFMRRPTISSELKQSAIGAFIMQVLNLGWLALLSNIGSFKKIWSYFSPPFEPLFRVMCQDFTISKKITIKLICNNFI